MARSEAPAAEAVHPDVDVRSRGELCWLQFLLFKSRRPKIITQTKNGQEQATAKSWGYGYCAKEQARTVCAVISPESPLPVETPSLRLQREGKCRKCHGEPAQEQLLTKLCFYQTTSTIAARAKDSRNSARISGWFPIGLSDVCLWYLCQHQSTYNSWWKYEVNL